MICLIEGLMRYTLHLYGECLLHMMLSDVSDEGDRVFRSPLLLAASQHYFYGARKSVKQRVLLQDPAMQVWAQSVCSMFSQSTFIIQIIFNVFLLVNL